MVFLHVKRDKKVQFYIEVPAVTPVSKVATQAAEMHNLIRRIRRICTEGARFAQQVLQSSEPTPKQEPADSDDDESPNTANSTAGSQTQKASAESAGVPALEGQRVSELPVKDAGDDSAAGAGTAAALDDMSCSAHSEKLTESAAQRPASSASDLPTAAGSCCARTAEVPHTVGALATKTAQPANMEAAPVAVHDADSTTPDASGTITRPPAVSEADEHFEALCRALLAASQLIVTAIHADIAPDTAVLWVASRKLDNGKTLAMEVGRNDKTRVTVTVQHAKEPAPPRSMDPPPEEYDQMLAFYYQWQEKDKRLEADMDLGYYNSPWANPRSLKHGLSGVGDVTMPKHGPRGFN